MALRLTKPKFLVSAVEPSKRTGMKMGKCGL